MITRNFDDLDSGTPPTPEEISISCEPCSEKDGRRAQGNGVAVQQRNPRCRLHQQEAHAQFLLEERINLKDLWKSPRWGNLLHQDLQPIARQSQKRPPESRSQESTELVHASIPQQGGPGFQGAAFPSGHG